MKRWKQMLLAWFLFLVYLLIGAFLFRAIELPQEEQAVEEFLKSMDEFLASHPCVSKTELLKYSFAVVEAVDRGVLNIHSNELNEDNEGKRKNIWDLPNSFFFSATLVTTIGYGDLAPQTSRGRICCMIYGAIGLPLTGWVLGVIARSLTAHWTTALDKSNKFLLSFIKFARLRKTFMFLVTTVLLYLILLQLPAVVIGYVIEQWDPLTSIYYCFITLTTIGFGDIVAGSHPEFSEAARWGLKICIVLYVILGLSLLVALSTAIAERAQKTVQKTIMSDNSYHLDEAKCSQKRRERSKNMLENEIVLKHIPDLSSARKENAVPLHLPHVTTNLDETPKDMERECTELQVISNQTEVTSPPCYDEVVDLSMSAESSFTKSHNGRHGSHLSVAEVSVHRTSLDHGTNTGRNGNISVISLCDCECFHVKNSSAIDQRQT